MLYVLQFCIIFFFAYVRLSMGVSVASSIIAGVLFLLVFIVGVCIYRLKFHPLAKYPGPALAKLTDLYAAYHAYKGDIHISMWKAHQQYGETIRFGPNRLLDNSVVGLHDIYHSKHVKKSKGYLPLVPTAGAYSVHTAIDKSMHRFKRKVLSQGLSDDVLKRFESAMLKHVELFCNILLSGDDVSADGWTVPKNMTHYCNHLSLDIMGEFGFGQDFQMQTRTEHRFLVDAIAASNVRTSVYAQFPRLAALKLEKILYPKGTQMRERFLKLTLDMATSRLAAGKNSKEDLFSFVVDAKDPESGHGFSMQELWSEAKFLIVAGSDTSSTVIAAALFYLTRYPLTYDSLVQEILGSFPTLASIHSGPALLSCTYLRAVINETMRMSPPAGGAMWREVEAEGVQINDNYIPRGYDVGTSMYAIHHNEDYFPDSYTFRPERWIPNDAVSEKNVQLAHAALNPFSLGSRGCIGKGLAYMELSDVLAMVVWTMEFRRPEGELGTVGEGNPGSLDGRHRLKEFQLEDHLTSTKNGPFVEFRRRDH